MDFALTDAERELRDRAAALRGRGADPARGRGGAGRRPAPGGDREAGQARGPRARLAGGNHPQEFGGQGWSAFEQVLVHEELGRNTNGIWWHMDGAYNVLCEGHARADRALPDADHARRARRRLRGHRGRGGSDAGGIAGTAVRTGDGWHLQAEKWFVTSGDVCDYYIVMVNVVDGDARLPTLFLVDRDIPGIEFVDDPPFTHNYPHGHPTIRFDCRLPADAVLGGEDGVGKGDEGQNEWFVEERIHIGARCVGAMRRLLHETVEWSLDRVQFETRIFDFQGVSFPLADSAADCVAARLLVYHTAQLADDPSVDRKLVHAHASMTKLFAAEAAYRCADRCVQAFGGRGYMRTNVAERFLRELRVDRIWEGTSEIQRLIVARGLERRGVDRLLSV